MLEAIVLVISVVSISLAIRWFCENESLIRRNRQLEAENKRLRTAVKAHRPKFNWWAVEDVEEAR